MTVLFMDTSKYMNVQGRNVSKYYLTSNHNLYIYRTYMFVIESGEEMAEFCGIDLLLDEIDLTSTQS